MTRHQRLNPVILSMFFLSGACGLIYQVTWMRILTQVFGTTVHAVATVLTAFLAGLALGSYLLGRYADTVRSPLRFYAILEVGIGLTALFSLLLFHLLSPIYLELANKIGPMTLGITTIRFVSSALVILPPTFLMGATLPAMSRHFVRQLDRFGSGLSALYALNTAGAVAGTLAAGFWLIKGVGIHPTLYLASVLNIGIGILCWALSERPDRIPSRKKTGKKAGRTRHHPLSQHLTADGTDTVTTGLLFVLVLSGFASLGYEVLWSRGLVHIIGTSTYSFVIMLAAFLVGIALGSLVAKPWIDNTKRPRRVFGWVQLGIAVSAMLTLPVLQELASADKGSTWFAQLSGGWQGGLTFRFALSFLVMLVPTLLIGMTFPLAARIWVRRLSTMGGDLGRVHAVSTLGNILGSFAAGFVLVPLLGIFRGIVVLAAMNLAGAVWGLFPFPRAAWYARAFPAAAVAGVLLVGLIASQWRPMLFSVPGEEQDDKVLYYKEGVTATVKVIQKHKNVNEKWISVDGVIIGASHTDLDLKQQALAHFPFLLSQNIEKGLSIGLGSGILVGEMARHRGIKEIDCLEISPSVVTGAGQFHAHNHGLLDNPKVNIIVDDGINYLLRSTDRYDVIASDAKSKPTHGGNSAFFSKDYFQVCRDHLSPKGLMIQWVPLHVPPEEYQVILRTFFGVFPHAYVWIAPPKNSFLIGTRAPLRADLRHLQKEFQDAAYQNLLPYGWRNPASFLSSLTATKRGLENVLGEGPSNSLERPLLEFYSLRDYAVDPTNRQLANLSLLTDAKKRMAANPLITESEAPAFADSWQASRLCQESLITLTSSRSRAGLEAGLQTLQRAVDVAPENEAVKFIAARQVYLGMASTYLAGMGTTGDESERKAMLQESLRLLETAVALQPEDYVLRLALAKVLMRTNRHDLATRALEASIRQNPGLVEARLLLADYYRYLDRFEEAAEQYREILRLDPESILAKSELGYLLTRSRTDVSRGFALLEDAYREHPKNPTVLHRYAMARFFNGETQAARRLIDRALIYDPENPRILRDRSQLIEPNTSTN